MILSKFWSRYDLQNFRKLNFLGDDQGELSKGTVFVFPRVAWSDATSEAAFIALYEGLVRLRTKLIFIAHQITRTLA